MASFTDLEERDWRVHITVGTIKRVKQLLDIDLMDAVNNDLTTRLINDPSLLVDVIHAVCKPQADDLKITAMDFAEAIAGDVLGDATDAVLTALIDFFPPTRREVLRTAVERHQQLEAKTMTMAIERIKNPALDRQVESAMAEQPGSLSLNASESSDSSPGTSPFVNS